MCDDDEIAIAASDEDEEEAEQLRPHSDDERQAHRQQQQQPAADDPHADAEDDGAPAGAPPTKRPRLAAQPHTHPHEADVQVIERGRAAASAAPRREPLSLLSQLRELERRPFVVLKKGGQTNRSAAQPAAGTPQPAPMPPSPAAVVALATATPSAAAATAASLSPSSSLEFESTTRVKLEEAIASTAAEARSTCSSSSAAAFSAVCKLEPGPIKCEPRADLVIKDEPFMQTEAQPFSSAAIGDTSSSTALAVKAEFGPFSQLAASPPPVPPGSRKSASSSAAAAYKPLLSDRDIVFDAPIYSGDDDDGEPRKAGSSVFRNAATSFTHSPYHANGSSTHFPLLPRDNDELHAQLAKEEAAQLAGASSTLSDAATSWPISMRGKSIADVSASAASKRARVARSRAQEEMEAARVASSLPLHSSHGPGISDHTEPKATYDGYWALRVAKLSSQKAEPAIYAQLASFATAERAAEIEAERVRRAEKEAAHQREQSRPDDLPFELGQHLTPPPIASQATSTQLSSTAASPLSSSSSSSASSSAVSSSVAAPPSHSRPSSKPSNAPIFAGVVVYFNGETETRAARGAGGASELSSFHLANQVKLHGGQVLPYVSRSALTHYIVDHLSYSKARDEFRAKFRAPASAATAHSRACKFVRPEWVRACLQAGRRVSEQPYSVMRDDSVKTIATMFAYKNKP